MSDINKGVFSGRISKMDSKEISSNSSDGGTLTIVNLNLAVNYYARKSKQELPMYIRVRVVGKRAEALIKRMEVGDQLIISGEWEPNDWEDTRNGVKHRELVLVASEIVYGRKKGDRSAANDNSPADTAKKNDSSKEGFYPIDEDMEEDDLPF